jgi:hypothetical protein
MRGLKDTPEFLKHEDYVKNIEESSRWKVILSDTRTRQHWLADGASTILHLCRAYISGKYTEADLQNVVGDIWSPTSSPGPRTSVKILLSESNRALRLYISNLKSEGKSPMPNAQQGQLQLQSDEQPLTREWFLFQDQAHLFYHWLEQIHDRMMLARRSDDIDLLGLFEGPRSIGFELRDLLVGNSDLEPYTLKLCDNAKAWLPYAKSVDAIHIQGSKLGDLLRPSQTLCNSSGFCDRETVAPQGKDFLMAPLSVLREGIDRFEHTGECAQLGKGIYWKISSEIFSTCQCRKSKPAGRCKAVVKKFHPKPLKDLRSQKSADDLPVIFQSHPHAAIIVGSETRTLTSWLVSSSKSERMTGGGHKNEEESRAVTAMLDFPTADSGYVSQILSASSSGGRAPSMDTRSPPTKRKTRIEDFFKRSDKPTQ